MAAGASSGRLLGATTASSKAFHPDNRLPSKSSSASGHAATRPCRIPSLKFPFLRETSTNGKMSRGAEQRAALITLGAPTASTTTQEKRRGLLRLPGGEADSVGLLLPLAYEVARRLVLRKFGTTWLALTRRCWTKIVEGVIHQGVVRCQSFTLIGVAGSLVGSVPCFLEGCGFVVESFLLQFRAMSQVVDQAEIIKLLIEALDMFLIGTALLTFGMGNWGCTACSTAPRTSRSPCTRSSRKGRGCSPSCRPSRGSATPSCSCSCSRRASWRSSRACRSSPASTWPASPGRCSRPPPASSSCPSSRCVRSGDASAPPPSRERTCLRHATDACPESRLKD